MSASAHKFPSIRNLTHALKCEQKLLRRYCSKEDLCDPYDRDSAPGTDVRLQVNGASWFVRSGSADYDQDHRGTWGAAFLPWGRTNLAEIARDLLSQAKEGER